MVGQAHARKSPILLGIALVLCGLVVRVGTARADKVDDLMRQLKGDADYKVRLSAALNLGKIGDKRAIGPLTDALDDKDKTVRGVAAAALGKLVDGSVDAAVRDRAIKTLERVAKNDPDNFVKGQAQKSFTSLKGLLGGGGSTGPGPAAGGIYVNIGPMSNSTKLGAALLPVMRTTIEKTMNKKAPAIVTQWPGGKLPSAADLTKAGMTGFYVDGTLTTLDVKKTGSTAEVGCNVSLIIGSFPSKAMFAFPKGGAAVQTGTSQKDIDEAAQDCVTAVLADNVARFVVPTIQQRGAAKP